MEMLHDSKKKKKKTTARSSQMIHRIDRRAYFLVDALYFPVHVLLYGYSVGFCKIVLGHDIAIFDTYSSLTT